MDDGSIREFLTGREVGTASECGCSSVGKSQLPQEFPRDPSWVQSFSSSM
jgi:hypothetical protein